MRGNRLDYRVEYEYAESHELAFQVAAGEHTFTKVAARERRSPPYSQWDCIIVWKHCITVLEGLLTGDHQSDSGGHTNLRIRPCVYAELYNPASNVITCDAVLQEGHHP